MIKVKYVKAKVPCENCKRISHVIELRFPGDENHIVDLCPICASTVATAINYIIESKQSMITIPSDCKDITP